MDYAVYTELGFKRLDKDSFEKVITDSEVLISNLTLDYYRLHDIDDDLKSDNSFLKYKATQYQRAVCLQCEYADTLGDGSLVGQQLTALTDVQIGRTHLQRTSNAANGVTYGKSGVVKSAYDILGRTGLLYRGVDVR